MRRVVRVLRGVIVRSVDDDDFDDDGGLECFVCISFIIKSSLLLLLLLPLFSFTLFVLLATLLSSRVRGGLEL